MKVTGRAVARQRPFQCTQRLLSEGHRVVWCAEFEYVATHLTATESYGGPPPGH